MAQSEFSHLFWPSHEDGDGGSFKTFELLLSSLKSHYDWMALEGRKWVENTDMQIKYKKNSLT